MENIPSFCLVALLIFTTASLITTRCYAFKCDYLSVTGGGCPNNIEACREACKPCYTGVGRIIPTCDVIWGTNVPECRCNFVDGAPCPPPPPARAKCPKMLPSAAVVDSVVVGNNRTH